MGNEPIVRTVGAISLGAIAGALSRYYVGLIIGQLLGTQMPYGTLFANLTGCFIMGLLTTISFSTIVRIHPDLRLLVLTGFLGSYTTFSSYELDVAKLIEQQHLQSALLYWGGSVLLGWLSLELGTGLAKWILRQWEHRSSV